MAYGDNAYSDLPYSGQAGPKNITGTATASERHDTSTASGAITVSGTSAVTEHHDTSSVTAVITVSGTLARTTANDGRAMTGSVNVIGTMTKTEAVDSTFASPIALGSGGSSGGTICSPNLPASAVAGDLFILLIETNSGDTVSFFSTGGATWTEFSWSPLDDGASNGSQMRAWWAVYDGVFTRPTLQISDATKHILGEITAWRNVPTTSEGAMVNVSASGVKSVASSSITLPSITTTVDHTHPVYMLGISLEDGRPDDNWVTSTGTDLGNTWSIGVTTGDTGRLTLREHFRASGDYSTPAGAQGTVTVNFTSTQFGGPKNVTNTYAVVALAPLSTTGTVTAASISGTSTKTEGADTSSASGTLTVSGTLAKTNANDTESASGLVRYVGSMADTEHHDTLTASGSYQYLATAADTEHHDTSAASGSYQYLASATDTEHHDSLTASGSILVTGTLAKAEQHDTSSVSALVKVIGSAADTEQHDSATTSALVTVSGSLAKVEGKDTSNAVGGIPLPVSGTSADTEHHDTPAVSGAITVSGSLSKTTANDTSTVSGIVANIGTQAASEHHDTTAASGAVKVIGTSAASGKPDAMVASGVNLSPVSGTALATEQHDISTITATVPQPVPPPVTSRSSGGGGAEFVGNYFFRNRHWLRKLKERLEGKKKPPEPDESTVEKVEPVPPPQPVNISGTVQSITRKAEFFPVQGRGIKRGSITKVAKTEAPRFFPATGHAVRIGETEAVVRKAQFPRAVFKNDTTRIEWEAIEIAMLDEADEEEEFA